MENDNVIKGFHPCNGVQSISHLQSVDDTLLFCDADEDQLCNVKAINSPFI